MSGGLQLPTRRARPAFEGKNGFTEHIAFEDAHRHALYILENKGIAIE